MTLEIVTPSKILCSYKNVTKIKAPGVCGDFGVWEKHVNFGTMLGSGVVSFTVKEEDEEKEYNCNIEEGFFGIVNNSVIILAEKGTLN